MADTAPTPDAGGSFDQRCHRPWIVHAYVAAVLMAIPYDIAWFVTHERLSVFNLLWSLGATGIAIVLIWHASRTGWVLLAAWGVVSIPFVLAATGWWLYAVIALHAMGLAILLSPSMLRWIWRDGRGRPRIETV